MKPHEEKYTVGNLTERSGEEPQAPLQPSIVDWQVDAPAPKSIRRLPTYAMVEAGRKAMEPEKFVSHARAIWVWQAMWDAAALNTGA